MDSSIDLGIFNLALGSASISYATAKFDSPSLDAGLHVKADLTFLTMPSTVDFGLSATSGADISVKFDGSAVKRVSYPS